MTTATTAAATTTILALDLGKYKSVACAYDPKEARAVSTPSRPAASNWAA